jgi:hypothetical protein
MLHAKEIFLHAILGMCPVKFANPALSYFPPNTFYSLFNTTYITQCKYSLKKKLDTKTHFYFAILTVRLHKFTL